MSADGNGGQKPKLANFMRWFYTVVIVVAGLGLVLFNPNNIVYNPDDALEEAEVGSIGWFPTYPGQSAALQILGTFIAAVGAVAPLLDILRRTGSVTRRRISCGRDRPNADNSRTSNTRHEGQPTGTGCPRCNVGFRYPDLDSGLGMGLRDKVGLAVAEVPVQIQRLKGGRYADYPGWSHNDGGDAGRLGVCGARSQ